MRLGRFVPILLSIGVLIGFATEPAQASKRITEYPVPTPASNSFDIAAGPDGNLWFTEGQGNNIGKITPEGVFIEYPIPTPSSVRSMLQSPRQVCGAPCVPSRVGHP